MNIPRTIYDFCGPLALGLSTVFGAGFYLEACRRGLPIAADNPGCFESDLGLDPTVGLNGGQYGCASLLSRSDSGKPSCVAPEHQPKLLPFLDAAAWMVTRLRSRLVGWKDRNLPDSAERARLARNQYCPRSAAKSQSRFNSGPRPLTQKGK
jgi:hypothetical protein